MTKKQKDWVKTAIRLPPDLHAEIISAAEHNGRTMNAEMVFRMASASTIDQIAKQNVRTQEMVQVIIDAIGARQGPDE